MTQLTQPQCSCAGTQGQQELFTLTCFPHPFQMGHLVFAVSHLAEFATSLLCRPGFVFCSWRKSRVRTATMTWRPRTWLRQWLHLLRRIPKPVLLRASCAWVILMRLRTAPWSSAWLQVPRKSRRNKEEEKGDWQEVKVPKVEGNQQGKGTERKAPRPGKGQTAPAGRVLTVRRGSPVNG